MTFHFIPHTHWDREWYLPLVVFQSRLVTLIDDALDRLEHDDMLRVTLDGQTVLLEDYLTFRPERREIEESKFWFADLAHWPRVFKPFDTIMVEFAAKCLGQYNTRHYLVPPANGIDYRVHNGYTYMNPVAVPESEIPRACRSSSSAPGTTTRTGPRCWRTGSARSGA